MQFPGWVVPVVIFAPAVLICIMRWLLVSAYNRGVESVRAIYRPSDKKVVVSGCFDVLHTGHCKFLNEASAYGRLLVYLGSDENIEHLKGAPPVFTAEERRMMLLYNQNVWNALVVPGLGDMHFAVELAIERPDTFVVNEDGHTEEKEKLCKRLGIEYVVLERKPMAGCPAHSSTEIKEKIRGTS